MEEPTTKLIELLVNNKKKKKSDNGNKDLRIKLLEILDVLIDDNQNENNQNENQNENNQNENNQNDLKKMLINFFNLYITINSHILKHHGNIKDIKNIIDNMIDNIISKTETIKSEEITKVINIIKDKKHKIEFINIEKIT